jgi:predicted GH43/DUF377 family glycosyl hydrolase
MIKIKREKLLLKPQDFKPSSSKFEVIGVLNPAAVRMKNGKIMLFVRVSEKLKKSEDDHYCYSPRMIGKNRFEVKIDKFKENLVEDKGELDFVFKNGTKRLNFTSHLRRVILDKSGFRVLSIDKKPFFYGLKKNGELGVEDPRITKIGDRYIMTYVVLSRKHNISTALAVSKDLKNWQRKGIIFGQQDKDVVIFPGKVDDEYVAFDRPEGSFQFTAPRIWIAYSKNLTDWGGLKAIDCLYKDEKGACPRNGAGPPPIKTSKGWLLLYHTVVKPQLDKKEKKSLEILRKYYRFEEHDLEKVPFYCVGAALFDLDNPGKLIAKTDEFLMIPERTYEMGTFEAKGVVFPTGIVPDQNGKDLLVYGGGGDVVTTVKKVSLSSILRVLKPVKKRGRR